MKAIIYTSNIGSTAEYAQLLGKELNLPVHSLQKAKNKVPAGSEIIYLGWIMAGGIKGYKKAAKLYKVCVVCGVGMGQTGTHEEYKSWNIDVCYCSPLIRAVETAQIVLKNRGIPIITDERLVEMSFGDYEGIENSFKIPDCPINLIFRKPEEYIESIGGAETFAELFARTGSFLKEVIEPQLQEGKDILIVGHGAMNSSIICQVKNKPIEEFWSAGLEQCKILQL